MSFPFKATGSRDVFVGRQDEQKKFEGVLAGELPQWIIHIPGKGGMGKTRLLEYIRDRACDESLTLVTQNLIDFYDATNRTKHSFLSNIAEQLGMAHFKNFIEERQYMLRQRDPSSEDLKRVNRAFLKDYRAILEKGCRVVLLFDTCEEMHTAEEWILKDFLNDIVQIERLAQEANPDINPEEERVFRTIAVFAGRKQLEFPDIPAHHVLQLQLDPITQEDIREYFDQGEYQGEALDDTTLKRLAEISGGRPLYVSLIFDWLQNGVGTIKDLFDKNAPIGEKLVFWVRRMREEQAQAILCAALAWRRVEPDLLARLLAVSPEEAYRVIEELKKFSFAKYRPAYGDFKGSFQLQDEFRDLVLRYVWPQEGIPMQQALYQEIIEWYRQRIGDPTLLQADRPPRNDEEGALLAEWLYYHCKMNLSKGAQESEKFFRSAFHKRQLDFCELLLQELKRKEFEFQFSEDEQNTLDFRTALLLTRQGKPEARDLFEALINRPRLDPVLKVTSQTELVQIYASKDPERAFELAQETEISYQKLIEEAEQDTAQKQLLETQLGHLYNNWGFAFRSCGGWPEAIAYYKRALEMPTQPKNKAITLNNMGYAYSRIGEVDLGCRLVLQAISIREKLDIPNELGLSYNTLGIIYDEAGRPRDASLLYKKALDQFELARSETGTALVYLNLGRRSRHDSEFAQSIRYLEEALQVFESEEDKVHLIEALNELGCTYREQRTLKSFEDAEKLLKRSLALSQEMSDEKKQTDNLEDLSILYYCQFEDAIHHGDEAAARKYERLAQEHAEDAYQIAEQHHFFYLKAKSFRSLGKLAQRRGDYDRVYDCYLEACRLLKIERQVPPAFLQSRFDNIVDEIYLSFLELPDPALKRVQAQRLLEKYRALPDEEQSQLGKLEIILTEILADA